MRYRCTHCNHWFHINRAKRSPLDTQLTLAHLDGASFRSLADRFGVNHTTIYRKVTRYLESLPHCADVSRQYCSKYSGILEVDGKFVKVKGYERKIPVIYGIDYQTHDIPTYRLAQSEGYQACLKYFSSLKLLNYPLMSLVADDNPNIKMAGEFVYPKLVFQLCQRHFKQGVKLTLNLTENPHYQSFFSQVIELFASKRAPDDFNRCAKNIFNQCKTDPTLLAIILDIHQRQVDLLGWRGVKNTPVTTNLIECFNSHLQGRLKTIKGFESFKHANLWLNGYFIRRRTRKFTDCQGKFSRLNGKTSLSQTKKPGIDLPNFF